MDINVEGMDIPKELIETVAHGLMEMNSEVNAVGIWYELSAVSVGLIKESSERQLSKVESSKIASDFLQAGLLMRNMTNRNQAIVRIGIEFLSKIGAEGLDDEIQEFLSELNE